MDLYFFSVLRFLGCFYHGTGIDLKKASKSFAQHFSCGSSVTGEDVVEVQGNVCDDVVDFILQEYPNVREHSYPIFDVNKKH